MTQDYTKIFAPKTRGGYEWEVFAERDGKMWGRYKYTDGWHAVIWLLDGHVNDVMRTPNCDLLPRDTRRELVEELRQGKQEGRSEQIMSTELYHRIIAELEKGT